MEVKPLYMARALQLARNGAGHVSPNPMVGAVIVGAGGDIIGEGWHRLYGRGHAEVNAVASVADRALLRDATMYVTLEPCSHYGKTPPCARLIIECGIPRVVVATLDPFEKVSGRGVAMLREAGVEVEVGLMESEARELNRAFFTAHTLRRPFTMLKWAQSADGYIDRHRSAGEPAERFSTSLTAQAVHIMRSRFDAIMAGSTTVAMDTPRLDVRHVEGKSPRPVILDRRGRLDASQPLLQNPAAIYVGPEREGIKATVLPPAASNTELLHALYAMGVTSLLVEGGKSVLDSFIADGLWDACRIEIAPKLLGEEGAHRMKIPAASTVSSRQAGKSLIIDLTR